MKYKIKLKNGDIEYFTILDYPVFKCMEEGDGSNHYLTFAEIAERRQMGQSVKIIDSQAHTIFKSGLGFIIDEGAIFSVYKGLRNPIIELKLIKSK